MGTAPSKFETWLKVEESQVRCYFREHNSYGRFMARFNDYGPCRRKISLNSGFFAYIYMNYFRCLKHFSLVLANSFIKRFLLTWISGRLQKKIDPSRELIFNPLDNPVEKNYNFTKNGRTMFYTENECLLSSRFMYQMEKLFFFTSTMRGKKS